MIHKILNSKVILKTYKTNRKLFENLVGPKIIYKLGKIVNRSLNIYEDYSLLKEFKRGIKNILFVIPKLSYNEKQKKIIPISSLYLASYIRLLNNDLNINILDCHGINIPEDITREKLMQDWDIICFSYWTAQAEHAYTLSNFVKDNSNAMIIHGGVHATLCPEEAVNYCDYVVSGEGEEIFNEIVNLFPDRKKIKRCKGIIYKDKELVIRNEPRALINNLDSIPFPAWELLPYLERYDFPMHIVGGPRMAVIGSRGCPYNCSFCSSPLIWKKKVRYRSAENVLKELAILKNEYGYSNIHFWDDNLMMYVPYLESLCNLILKNKVVIKWVGLTRAEHVIKNKKLLSLMKKAGCIGMEIGVESFSDQVISYVNKDGAVYDMIKAVNLLIDHSITPLFTHMLFVPGETLDGYKRKEDFIKNISLPFYASDSYMGQFSTPHVKTQFARNASQFGVVFAKKNSDYFHGRINFLPYSLLNDIPYFRNKVKIGKKFLTALYYGRILNKVKNFKEEDFSRFLKINIEVLRNINGKSSILEIFKATAFHMNITSWENVAQYAIITIVELAKQGTITSNSHEKK